MSVLKLRSASILNLLGLMERSVRDDKVSCSQNQHLNQVESTSNNSEFNCAFLSIHPSIINIQ